MTLVLQVSRTQLELYYTEVKKKMLVTLGMKCATALVLIEQDKEWCHGLDTDCCPLVCGD